MIYNFSPIPIFEAWLGFSGSIPDIYWNTYSEEQRYKFLCKRIQMLVEYVNELGITLNTSMEEIEALAKEILDFKTDFYENFDEYFKEHVCEWLNTQLTCLIGQAVKFVQFGFTNDGRLAIHIPTNWKFLEFYTPMDYDDQTTYGKLCIKY